MSIRASDLKAGDVIWRLNYQQDTESGEVVTTKEQMVAVTECTYNKNLSVWDASHCYRTEEEALVAAASKLQYDATQAMQRSQRIFERLTKLRTSVLEDTTE